MQEVTSAGLRRLETGPFDALEGQTPYGRRDRQSEMGDHGEKAGVAGVVFREVAREAYGLEMDDEWNGSAGV